MSSPGAFREAAKAHPRGMTERPLSEPGRPMVPKCRDARGTTPPSRNLLRSARGVFPVYWKTRTLTIRDVTRASAVCGGGKHSARPSVLLSLNGKLHEISGQDVPKFSGPVAPPQRRAKRDDGDSSWEFRTRKSPQRSTPRMTTRGVARGNLAHDACPDPMNPVLGTTSWDSQ